MKRQRPRHRAGRREGARCRSQSVPTPERTNEPALPCTGEVNSAVYASTCVRRTAAHAPNLRAVKVLICGSRHWTDRLTIEKRLRMLWMSLAHGETLLVITGGARGADTIADDVAREL